jgi:hypothetical protein
MEAQMRTTQALVIAVVATAFLALAVKAVFFSAPKAEADDSSMPSAFELHRNYPNMKDLPVQEVENPL